MSDPLVLRYQQYFRHPDYDHEVLEAGAQAVACVNLRRALAMLGMEVSGAPSDELFFDDELRESFLKIQDRYLLRVADG